MQFSIHIQNKISPNIGTNNTIALPLLIFETLGFMFLVFCLHFKQYVSFLHGLKCIYYFKLLLIISLHLITSLIPIFYLLQSN